MHSTSLGQTRIELSKRHFFNKDKFSKVRKSRNNGQENTGTRKHEDYMRYASMQAASSKRLIDSEYSQDVTKVKDVVDEFQDSVFQLRKSKQNQHSTSDTKLDLSMIDDDKKPLTSEQFIKIYRRKQRGKSKQSMNMQGQSLYPFPDSEKFKSL
jgi:hypothetical protein